MAILFRNKNKNEKNSIKLTSGISKYLLIDENVGKEDIKALHVEVKKSTHKKSCITAEQVCVNEHCGEIIGGDVEINYLKGGKVTANTVTIGTLQSGDVKANYVHINNLGSNNKILSTNIIEVNRIEGIKNTLVIKPSIDENVLNKISNLYDRVALFKRELGKISSQLDSKLKEIEGQKKDVQEHKSKIEKTRQNGDIPGVDLLMSVKEFNMNIREYDTLIDAIKGLEKYIKEDEDEFSKLQDDIILNGKIIINSFCKENNNILFILPKYDLRYNIIKNDNIREIYLKYSGSDKFHLEIKRRETQQ
ncbi:MAG: hypothetical protein LBD84_06515 [Campylobacteraceae bacterium]|jgi:DNA repair exonuclease SbcCD ATPase subunit|nr:hypothetical protein [Campylobacteraceae bacterium]